MDEGEVDEGEVDGGEVGEGQDDLMDDLLTFNGG
jgi:hypothetical protein